MVFCLMLAGCGHEHTWVEATCTEPRTCSECGEVEGEALGHAWVDATCSAPKTCSVCGATEGETLEHVWVDASCSAPKTCSVCGATEGEALEHTLTEANYQQEATCKICGETVGEPLQADFEKYNVTENFVELDKEYNCVVACNDDSSRTTNAKIIFSDYQTFTSGTPETSGDILLNIEELPQVSDYEYKSVYVTVKFSDENAIKYGASVTFNFEDYYDVVGTAESSKNMDDGWSQWTANWNGTDYTECIAGSFYGWNTNSDDTYSFNAVYIVRMPVGYDGCVLVFRNGQVEYGDDQYIYDIDNADTVFFRFE